MSHVIELILYDSNFVRNGGKVLRANLVNNGYLLYVNSVPSEYINKLFIVYRFTVIVCIYGTNCSLKHKTLMFVRLSSNVMNFETQKCSRSKHSQQYRDILCHTWSWKGWFGSLELERYYQLLHLPNLCFCQYWTLQLEPLDAKPIVQFCFWISFPENVLAESPRAWDPSFLP